MGARQELMLRKIEFLRKNAEIGRQFIMQMAMEPNKRKEPIFFSAGRAAEILDRATATLGRLLRKDDHSIDVELKRFQIDQTTFAQLREHFAIEPERSLAKVLVVANQKGGVGKTTTVAHLAPWLALHGYRTLVIDGDSQGSYTSYQGLNPDAEITEADTISPVLTGHVIDLQTGDLRDDDGTPCKRLTLSDLIRHSPNIEGLHFVPACLDLANGDIGTYQRQLRGDPGFTFYSRLYQGIESVRTRYDVILIDCPPHISAVTWNCVFAADMILVPLGAHQLDFASTLRFIDWMHTLVTQLPDVPLARLKFLLTNYDEKSASRENTDMIESVLGEDLLKARAVNSSEVQRASTLLKSIYELSKNVGHKDAYRRACVSMDAVNREICSILATVTPYTKVAPPVSAPSTGVPQ